jgi:hypothetical protein
MKNTNNKSLNFYSAYFFTDFFDSGKVLKGRGEKLTKPVLEA